MRLVATVKDGGSCGIQRSYNTWDFTWSNDAGRVKVTYDGSSYDFDCMHGRGTKIENVSCQERGGGVHFVRRP